MKKYLKLFALITLIFLSSGGVVHAESLNDNIAPSPLRKEEPVLQKQSEIVAQKQSAIDDAKDQISELFQKKQDLAQKLQDEQGKIQDLKQQISNKKTAVEAVQVQVKVLEDMFVHINHYASDAAGNMYDAGNCTWYVKSRRPDIGNQWGNANTWYANAQAEGWSVGSKPKKGAVGTSTRGSYGHVVYVDGVNQDGTITVTEMNYDGLYSLRTRTANASEFQYIYELD